MNRTFYSCSIDGANNEREVDVLEAMNILSDYISRQKARYDSDVEATADSLFGFSIDNSEFIEISIDGKGEYRIKLECKRIKSIWKFSWNSLYQKEYHINDKLHLNDLIKEFFTKNINAYRDHFDAQDFMESPSIRFS